MLMKGDGARVEHKPLHACTDCMQSQIQYMFASIKPTCVYCCVHAAVCMWVCPTPAHLPLRGHMVVGLDWDWRLVATAISQPVISLCAARINLPTDGWLLSITSWNTHIRTDIHDIRRDYYHHNQCTSIRTHRVSIIHSDCIAWIFTTTTVPFVIPNNTSHFLHEHPHHHHHYGHHRTRIDTQGSEVLLHTTPSFINSAAQDLTSWFRGSAPQPQTTYCWFSSSSCQQASVHLTCKWTFVKLQYVLRHSGKLCVLLHSWREQVQQPLYDVTEDRTGQGSPLNQWSHVSNCCNIVDTNIFVILWMLYKARAHMTVLIHMCIFCKRFEQHLFLAMAEHKSVSRLSQTERPLWRWHFPLLGQLQSLFICFIFR